MLLGNNDLCQAVRNGDMAQVRYLVEDLRVSPDLHDDLGRTPLWIAMNTGRGQITAYLMSKDPRWIPIEASNRTKLSQAELWWKSQFFKTKDTYRGPRTEEMQIQRKKNSSTSEEKMQKLKSRLRTMMMENQRRRYNTSSSKKKRLPDVQLECAPSLTTSRFNVTTTSQMKTSSHPRSSCWFVPSCNPPPPLPVELLRRRSRPSPPSQAVIHSTCWDDRDGWPADVVWEQEDGPSDGGGSDFFDRITEEEEEEEEVFATGGASTGSEEDSWIMICPVCELSGEEEDSSCRCCDHSALVEGQQQEGDEEGKRRQQSKKEEEPTIEERDCEEDGSYEEDGSSSTESLEQDDTPTEYLDDCDCPYCNPVEEVLEMETSLMDVAYTLRKSRTYIRPWRRGGQSRTNKGRWKLWDKDYWGDSVTRRRSMRAAVRSAVAKREWRYKHYA